MAELTLEGNETAPEWKGHFQLVFTVQLWDNRLHSSLVVRNLGQGAEATFWQHALQHTYYATPDVTQVRVQGLKGLAYLDKVAGGEQRVETGDSLGFDCNVDRIYMDRPRESPLVLTHLGIAPEGQQGSGKYTAEVNASCGMMAEGQVSVASATQGVPCALSASAPPPVRATLPALACLG